MNKFQFGGEVLTLEPEEAVKVWFTRDLGLVHVKCKVSCKLQVPSPISNVKSSRISWVLLSSWKYLLTLISNCIAIDERRQHILVVLALLVVIKHVTIVFLKCQQIIIYEQKCWNDVDGRFYSWRRSNEHSKVFIEIWDGRWICRA